MWEKSRLMFGLNQNERGNKKERWREGIYYQALPKLFARSSERYTYKMACGEF